MKERLTNDPCDFDLHIVDEEGVMDWSLIEVFVKSSELGGYFMDESGCPTSSGIWSTWDEELIEFSREYPDRVIVLYVNNNDFGYYGRVFFKNGMNEEQFAQIIYPQVPSFAQAFGKHLNDSD
jgi:hypothetical protein